MQHSLLPILASIILSYCNAQGNPPPDRPDCSAGWHSTELTYVPTLSMCSDYDAGSGVPCSPSAPYTCTGRNPFCAQTEGKDFRCCSDIVQDSADLQDLEPEQIKPICPNGAIPYKIPQVTICDPSIVNICPNDYTCVEAGNGHLLPPESRSLCCKTSTLYSFAKVFLEVNLTPRIVPQPPLASIDFVTLNVHTSMMMHAPEIRTEDHFVLAPYKLLEPAYLKKVTLFHEPTRGSYLHVVMFNPNSKTEHMQFYYDRKSSGKTINLDEPIADGGFISKHIVNQPFAVNMEQHRAVINENYRKMWVVLVYKTVDPLTRLFVSVSTDLNAKYRSVVEFLRSDTGKRLGTPVAGNYFFLTAE